MLLGSLFVVVVVVVVFFVRRKWLEYVERSEEVKRLLVSASEESFRVEFEAREVYNYYSDVGGVSDNVSPVSSPVLAPVYGSGLGGVGKVQYQCAVCFSPTTTRCSKCKAVRYCSGKCQIIHWRQGHKDECRPYVAVNPSDDVGGSPFRQGGCKVLNDGFDSEAKQPATLFSEDLHHKGDVGVESYARQHATSTPFSNEGHSDFSTPTKLSAGATFENFEIVKSAHQTVVGSARKSTVLGNISRKKYNLTDQVTQSVTSSSSFWTADGSNESSLSEPATNASVFWDGTNPNKKSSINGYSDGAPCGFGEAANVYSTTQTTKGVSNSDMVNGFSSVKIIDGSGPIGLGSKKYNDIADSPKDDDGFLSGMPQVERASNSTIKLNRRDGGSGSDLPPSKVRESKTSPSGAASHPPTTAGYSKPKDDKAFGGLPSSGAESSNHVIINKSATPHISKPMEVVSSLSRASDTHLTTLTNRHTSHGTKRVKVDDDIHRVTTCSFQMTETSRSVRSGSKTSKLKVADNLKPIKLSRQESLEGGNEITHRYNFMGLFSYEMFVKLYNWKQVQLQPFGLKNCGNSCYANAVLQCLVYTPPLTAYLLEGVHSKACDKKGWCFTCELEGLVMKAKGGYSPLSPIRLLTHIENIGSHLGHGKEEDAHEFLRYVIDALQSVCIREAGRNALNSLEEETTLVGLTFGGYLRSKVICMKCGVKSERHERIMDLTVEIEGDIVTLEEALDKFTCTEVLDGENKYKCSRCKSYEKGKKKLTLLEAPNVLTIALKRFQSGKFGKLNKSIHFPEILDMAPYVSGTSDKSPIYRLYGVVVHLDTMNAAFSGHYVCYIKNFQNRWFKFDDSLVKEVDLQHVLAKGAYMLLYARCSPRAPRSIRSSLVHNQDPRKHKAPVSSVSRSHSTELWDACNYHPQVHNRSLEEESSSSSDNSGFFSESCSCSTENNHRDSTIEEQDYWKNVNLSSSDSDTSSNSSFPSPLYSRLSKLYTSKANSGDDQNKVSKV
nr:ubiquitin carboxyl-terminal hydrolase 17-like [Tanacetum cinerariifolium]